MPSTASNTDRQRRVCVLQAPSSTSVSLARLLASLGWRVAYLRCPPALVGRLSRFGERIDLTKLDSLDLSERGPEASARQCLAIVDQWHCDESSRYLSDRFCRGLNGSGVLRTGMARRLTSASADAFTIDTWVRSQPHAAGVVLAQSWWDAALFKSYLPQGFTCTSSPDALSQAISRLRSAFTALLKRHLRGSHGGGSTGARSDQGASHETAMPVSNMAAASPTVAMFLPQGLEYGAAPAIGSTPARGAMYSFDFWLAKDPESPLHPVQMAFLSSAPCEDPVGRPCAAYPAAPVGIRAALSQLRLMVGIPWRFWKRTPWRALRQQCSMVARAQAMAENLSRQYPDLKVAVIAYELQFPSDLMLALDVLGVRTMAVSERPAMAFRSVVPFAVETLLTPGPAFSKAVSESKAVATLRTVDVGLWRTDLAIEARAARPPELVRTGRREFRKVVLVLPFDLRPLEDPSEYPLATGLRALSAFLNDVLCMAERQPDVFFVVRGKNGNWLDIPALSDVNEKIEESRNVVADRDYASAGRSYALAAFADAVVARPTSLVDELLALEVPTVIHDFAPGAKNLARASYPYLPDVLWADSLDVLQERLAFCLADDGEPFRRIWRESGDRLFGSLSDGHVRDRVRGVTLALLDEEAMEPVAQECH